MLDFSVTVVWFLLAAVLMGAELLVGTFYLLVVGVSSLAGGFAAYLGFSMPWQFLMWAIVLVLGTFIVRRFNGKNKESEALQNLDQGQRVTVEDVDGQTMTQVHYRGAIWQAVADGKEHLSAGVWTIKEVRGSQLILTQR